MAQNSRESGVVLTIFRRRFKGASSFAAMTAIALLSIHSSAKTAEPVTSIKRADGELTLLPGETARYETLRPGGEYYSKSNVVGVFQVTVDRKLYGRLRALAREKRSKALASADFKRVWKNVRKHPVRAVSLRCGTKDGRTRCDLRARGTEPTTLPMPGVTPYTFYCFDQSKRELRKLLDFSHSGRLPHEPLKLPAGARYPFYFPKGTSCSGSIVLKIPKEGGPNVLSGATLVAGKELK